ncbi:hypothetical protein ACM01_33890 [Streptomyces viridochromogenes]|uniref:Uncharacterized protein n=1 Tax=Streptomyces viridochromogenes TaxID=1938 RepID=A0A0J8BVX2_STRVR|nr:hypothetical protein [Streptomyces viridochromogenes]KMS69695.1 hypothetical protein ACM01_33890 [Streptomyces viridochromogenes]KOG14919.1 hypothetical protein ADK36_30710 [Streptomyces viridochromogenes]KOG15112.1 hypothetical protein ADK35_30355 [Streptomyces viridochromogenes]
MPVLSCASLALTADLGEVLAGRTGSGPVLTPAAVPAPRRPDRQQLARTAAARARRITPSVRSLPRRGGY